MNADYLRRFFRGKAEEKKFTWMDRMERIRGRVMVRGRGRGRKEMVERLLL